MNAECIYQSHADSLVVFVIQVRLTKIKHKIPKYGFRHHQDVAHADGKITFTQE